MTQTTVIEQVVGMKAWTEAVKSRSEAVIGFVPTMGALHFGHISLINKAKETCDKVVVSVFVNPTQFNNPEDLKHYPRTFERDKALLEEADCDVLFFPSVEEIYPKYEMGHWDFGLLSSSLEGHFRPGHFDGVLTVVKRLFEIVSPDKAFFGEKDFQQLSLIRKMVEYEHIPVEVIGSTLVREEDGLAMSSRNMRLNPEDRIRASAISKVLFEMKRDNRESSPGELIRLGIEKLSNSGIETEYIAIVEADSFEPIANWKDAVRPIVLLAAYVGGVRLIDNMFL